MINLIKCIFCNEEAKYKFKNKGICEDCIKQIKLIYKPKINNKKEVINIKDIQKTDIEKKYEKKKEELIKKYLGNLKNKNKNLPPNVLEVKRIND